MKQLGFGGGNVSREHMNDLFFACFRETIFELLAKYTHTDKDTVFGLSIHFNVHKAVDLVSRRAKQMKSLYSRQLSAFSELGFRFEKSHDCSIQGG